MVFFSPLLWFHGNFVKLEGLLARQFQGKPSWGWYLAKKALQLRQNLVLSDASESLKSSSTGKMKLYFGNNNNYIRGRMKSFSLRPFLVSACCIASRMSERDGGGGADRISFHRPLQFSLRLRRPTCSLVTCIEDHNTRLGTLAVSRRPPLLLWKRRSTVLTTTLREVPTAKPNQINGIKNIHIFSVLNIFDYPVA